MLDDVLENLTRQFRILEDTSEEHFPSRLRRLLERLMAEPRLWGIVEDLVSEAKGHQRAFASADTSIVQQLVQLRDEVVRLAPELDDRDKPLDRHFIWSFHFFAQEASREPPLALPAGETLQDDGSRSQRLLEVLRQKLGDAPESPERRRLLHRLANVAAAYRHARRTYVLQMQMSAGLSAENLKHACSLLIPEVVELPEEANWETVFVTQATQGLRNRFPLTLAAFEPKELKEDERDRLTRDVARLKREARQLNEEMAFRLHTTRSHRALVDRFKLRCESYDRNRLRVLGEGKPNPENLLVAELARYLFDAGLNPLTGPQIGGLRPDLAEQKGEWTFYLEAKQYDSREGARKAIRDGARQVWDTAAVLKSLGLREAFLVIFRRGGPHCALPPMPIHADGIALHSVLISVAPLSESGGRAEERPIDVTAEELAPVPRTDGEAP